MIDITEQHSSHHHPHDHHDHSHGVIDPSLFTSERGIWAIKWSLGWVNVAIDALVTLAFGYLLFVR